MTPVHIQSALANTANHSNGMIYMPRPSRSMDSGPKNSFQTPPALLSESSLKPLGQLLDNIATPTMFKEELLRTLPWDDLAGYPLSRYRLHDDIPVLEYNHATYYLRPDDAVLDHEPPPKEQAADTFYNQLLYNQRFGPDKEARPWPFTYANRVSGDFFLPLGSLVEIASDGNNKRLTNYCWALNISTDPVSLWLVFDYVKTNFLGDDTNVQLSQIYLNQGNESRGFPYTFDEVPQAQQGYLGLGSAWDVLKVFDDVSRDWQPTNAKAAKLDGAERWELGPSLRAYALQMPPEDSPGFRFANAEKS
ncbi:MAG: hypothetical protein Q9197_000669 [Variospora fuerteventurae]